VPDPRLGGGGVVTVGVWCEGDVADGVPGDGVTVTVVVTTEPLGPVVLQAVRSSPATAIAAASEPAVRSLTIGGYIALPEDYRSHDGAACHILHTGPGAAALRLGAEL
jgi:hypothetical protein